MIITNPYSAGSTGVDNTTVVNKAYVDGFINPIESTVNEVANSTAVTITNADSPYTITNNQEIYINVDCSSGNVVINLPNSATQYKSIKIKKIDNTNNTITINRAGSDVINNYYNTLITPTDTSFVIYLPSERYELSPRTFGSTIWEMIDGFFPITTISAYQSVDQTFTSGSFQIIGYDTDTGTDDIGWWNTTTYRFQPTFGVKVQFQGFVSFSSGGSAYGSIESFNGGTGNRISFDTETSINQTGNFRSSCNGLIDLNGSSDYISFRSYINTNNRDTNAGLTNTFCRFNILTRTG